MTEPRCCIHCDGPITSPRGDARYCMATACQSAKRAAARAAPRLAEWRRLPRCTDCTLRITVAVVIEGRTATICRRCHSERARLAAAERKRAELEAAQARYSEAVASAAERRCRHCGELIARGRYCAASTPCQSAKRAAARAADRRRRAVEAIKADVLGHDEGSLW